MNFGLFVCEMGYKYHYFPIHTQIHACVHTYIHARIYIHMRAHTHTHACMLAAYIHTNVHRPKVKMCLSSFAALNENEWNKNLKRSSKYLLYAAT